MFVFSRFPIVLIFNILLYYIKTHIFKYFLLLISRARIYNIQWSECYEKTETQHNELSTLNSQFIKGMWQYFFKIKPFHTPVASEKILKLDYS